MTQQAHILVVDDDNRLRGLLHRYLTENGFLVSQAACTAQARELMSTFTFDLMILDVMLPEENGFDFAKALRQQGVTMPILMLTAMGELSDRIQGLESGVDDYLPKPFSSKELLLRIQSILRRVAMRVPAHTETMLHFGDVVYDVEHQVIMRDSQVVPLTQVEKTLLRLLIAHMGNALPRSELAAGLQTDNERTVDVQVNRLRKKIEVDPKAPRYLQTVRGKGYMLLPD
ncbi:MAG: response regulator [Alphaproteobacteria bacterium]|nr:response regulator [Alphaproteobacteria bacterium]